MRILLTFLAAAVALLVAAPASANVDQLKIYRKAFPDLKPSCLYCHVDKVPKKGDGKHDLNAYGEKIKELGDLNEDNLKELGSHKDFEGEMNEK